ncbi:MAG TPA: lytic transglycosylase domain-containing protein [Candidatus Aminicenantes bacterium]|nr:lytic transglycosylase domain-containing protein [Candidatus Aminicenantes bacterium]
MRKSKFLYIFIPMAMAMAVLFSALVDVAHANESNHLKAQALSARMQKAEKELTALRSTVAQTGLIRYRDGVFRKREPEFANIVEVVYHKCRQYGVDPDLVISMIQVESDFRPNAVSNAGAYGLMQINYAVWKNELAINSKRLFEITYNIDLGVRILKHYLQVARGDVMRALHLYNNGYLFNNEAYKHKVTRSLYY